MTECCFGCQRGIHFYTVDYTSLLFLANNTTHTTYTCEIRAYIQRLNFKHIISFTNLGLRVLNEGEDNQSSVSILKEKRDNVLSSEVFAMLENKNLLENGNGKGGIE